MLFLCWGGGVDMKGCEIIERSCEKVRRHYLPAWDGALWIEWVGSRYVNLSLRSPPVL